MPTIADVAKEAGVSVSTVSYALSGKRPISANTKARIDQAIAALNYHPNAGARALASARSNVIALVAPLRAGATMAVVLEFVSGVVEAAREHDYNVLLDTQDDPTAINRLSGSASADALVVMDIELEDPRVPELQRLRQPAALIGVPDEPGALSCVDLDFYAAGRLAVQHLVQLGHRCIGFVARGDARIWKNAGYAVRSIAGVRDAAATGGAHIELIPSESTFAGGVAAADKLLTEHPETTAIIVHNEFALAGVLDCLERRGLQVPKDISVLAIALQSAMIGLARNVTLIEVPGYEMGRIAVELAIAKLDDPDRPGETRLLAPSIIDGGTTAVARSQGPAD